MEAVDSAFAEVLSELKNTVANGNARQQQTVIRNQTASVLTNAVAELNTPDEYILVVQRFNAFAKTVFSDVTIPVDIARHAVEKLAKKLHTNRLRGFKEFCIANRIDTRDVIESEACFAPVRTKFEQLEKKVREPKSPKLTRMEQDFLVGEVVKDWAESGSSRIQLEELFAVCQEAGAVRAQSWSSTVQRKFTKLLQKCIGSNLAVNDEVLINVKALEKKPELKITNDPKYDVGFLVDMHLLRRHFHEKKSGASSADYPGHNICCVAYDPDGNIAAMDFNQCKFDKNLCSHAEKRLAESIVESMKSTTPDGKPPSLEGWAFISSLEPCHMCANFISRMGVKTIGYLQGDPMQLDALAIAADMLDLTVVRPGTDWGVAMETAFKNSSFPEEEITSWLGSLEVRSLLDKLCEANPLPPQAQSFFEQASALYPGCVLGNDSLLRSSSNIFIEGADTDDDDSDVI